MQGLIERFWQPLEAFPLTRSHQFGLGLGMLVSWAAALYRHGGGESPFERPGYLSVAFWAVLSVGAGLSLAPVWDKSERTKRPLWIFGFVGGIAGLWAAFVTYGEVTGWLGLVLAGVVGSLAALLATTAVYALAADVARFQQAPPPPAPEVKPSPPPPSLAISPAPPVQARLRSPQLPAVPMPQDSLLRIALPLAVLAGASLLIFALYRANKKA